MQTCTFRKYSYLIPSRKIARLPFLASNIPWSSSMHAFRKHEQLLGGCFFQGELKWDPVAEEGSVPRETRWPWYTSSAVGPAPLPSLRYLLMHFSYIIAHIEIALFYTTRADSSHLSSSVINVRPFTLWKTS